MEGGGGWQAGQQAVDGDATRLLAVIAAARTLALLWLPILFVTGWVAGRPALIGCALVTVPMMVGLAFARRMVLQGRLARGAAVLAIVLDGGSLLLTSLVPWAYPVLAMTVLGAAAAVLPYLQGRSLGALFLGTGLSVATIGLLGVLLPETGGPGPWQKGILLVLGLVSNASLVVLLLWQFASRQRQLLGAERSAREHEEALGRQLTFLLEASTELSAALDEPRAQQALLQLLVPRLADLAALAMRSRDGGFALAAVRARSADDEPLLRELATHHPWQDDEVLGGAQALREGQSVRRIRLHQSWIAAEAGSARQAQLLGRLGVTSSVCLPITTRRGTEGLLLLAINQPHRELDPEQLAAVDAVAERATLALDNARLYREAIEGLQARDEFLSVAAHELRTPLTSLVLGVQAARELAGDLASDAGAPARAGAGTLARALGLVEQQCLRMTQLVETLLDLSRIHVGQPELNRAPVDLVQLAREVAGRAAAAQRASGSAVSVTGPADGDLVGQWDRISVEQAVSNLVANALKYGQGRPVELVVSRSGGLARLAVTDHGIGIPRERQQEIFERFVRAVSARQYGGLGLGLYIARRAVEAHGGSLTVQSQPGQGATFTLELPLEPPGR